ncbi:MAG: hypothetical protein AAGF73_18610 [Actinomycetota bacterium]
MPTSLPLLLCIHLMTIPTTIGNHIHRAADQRARRFGDRGQATTEYALILLAAALVGLLVVAWATAGGGAAQISRLFNRAIDSVIDRV